MNTLAWVQIGLVVLVTGFAMWWLLRKETNESVKKTPPKKIAKKVTPNGGKSDGPETPEEADEETEAEVAAKLARLKEYLNEEMEEIKADNKRRRNNYRSAIIMAHDIILVMNLIFWQGVTINVPAEYAKHIGNEWTWGMVAFFIQLFVVIINTFPNVLHAGTGGLRTWFGYNIDSISEPGIVHLFPGTKFWPEKNTLVDFETENILIEFGEGTKDTDNPLELQTLQNMNGFFQYRIFDHRLFRSRYENLKDAESDMKLITEGIMRRILGKITPAKFIANMETYYAKLAYELLAQAFKNGIEIGDVKMLITLDEELKKALGSVAEKKAEAKANKEKGIGDGNYEHEKARGVALGIGEIATGNISRRDVLSARTAEATMNNENKTLIIGNSNNGLGDQLLGLAFGAKDITDENGKEEKIPRKYAKAGIDHSTKKKGGDKK